MQITVQIDRCTVTGIRCMRAIACFQLSKPSFAPTCSMQDSALVAPSSRANTIERVLAKPATNAAANAGISFRPGCSCGYIYPEFALRFYP